MAKAVSAHVKRVKKAEVFTVRGYYGLNDQWIGARLDVQRLPPLSSGHPPALSQYRNGC